MASHPDKEEKFNPRRRLCPDGSCIGIIGSNGKCAVCGTADEPNARPEGEEPAVAEEEDLMPDGDDTTGDDRDAAEPAFDPKRRLCSDDTCIGVIGSDNRCSVCGKPAAP